MSRSRFDIVLAPVEGFSLRYGVGVYSKAVLKVVLRGLVVDM
jgi:hypothetical protein